ncbi:MAG: LuxR C-terminal-related transcriptional regulator [Tannerellaceae bacterium]|nr:LuxR C-terminal-related transcriptional regulator [Tannerellaceae bacterium]
MSNIPDENYNIVDLLINTFDAFSRTTNQSIYVIDYFKKDFLYVSPNPLFLCGHTPEEVKKLGYMFYMLHVPEQEQDMLAEINRAGFIFFDKIPKEERCNYTIFYDFHLKKGKKQTLINHRLTPILLTNEGKIWLAICVVSLSSNHTAGHIELRKTNQTSYWEYSLEGHRWKEIEGIILNEREKDILILSAQGYKINEIADHLCLATDTIKFYKRKIYDKLKVKNITEALSYAITHKIL